MSPRAACRLEGLGFKKVGDYVAGEADWIAAGLSIEGEAASEPRIGEILRDVPRVMPYEDVGKASKRVFDSGWKTAMVVNDDGVVLGRLYSSQLQGGDGWRTEELMQEGPSTTRASASIREAQHMMADNELTTLPVTTPEGKLLGMVLRKDLE